MFSLKRAQGRSLYDKGVYPADFTEEFKKSIRERDKNRCAICGHKKKPKESELDVHHVNFQKDTNRANCISLCRNCHTVVHKYNDPLWKRWWIHRLGQLAMCREKRIKRTGVEKRQIVHDMREVIKAEK